MRALALAAAALLLSACTPRQAIDVIFTGHDNATAHRIVACESGYNPNAVNPRSGASGVFQIHPFWNKPGHADPVADWIGRHWHRRFDPVTNALMAKMIRQTPRGWAHWECR